MKKVFGIFLALVLGGCSHVRHHVKSEHRINQMERIAVLPGVSAREDIQSRILEAFTLELSSPARFSIVSEEDMVKRLDIQALGLELPEGGALLEKGPLFSDIDKAKARTIRQALGVDGFVVLWIYEWYSGNVPKDSKVKGIARGWAKQRVRRDVVAQIFSADEKWIGLELWGSRYRDSRAFKPNATWEDISLSDKKDAERIGIRLARELAASKRVLKEPVILDLPPVRPEFSSRKPTTPPKDADPVAYLIGELLSSDYRARVKAVKELRFRGDARATEPLVKLLKTGRAGVDQHEGLWYLVCETLSQVGDSSALDTLKEVSERIPEVLMAVPSPDESGSIQVPKYPFPEKAREAISSIKKREKSSQ